MTLLGFQLFIHPVESLITDEKIPNTQFTLESSFNVYVEQQSGTRRCALFLVTAGSSEFLDMPQAWRLPPAT